MVFRNPAKFKPILFALSLLLAANVYAYEKDVGCSPLIIEKVKQYRHYILSGDVEGLSGSIVYPVKISFAGKKMNILNETVLSKLWRTIITKRFVGLVNSSDVCSLAKELNLDPVSHKIQSLVIFYDEEDSKYSYSYISSERELLDFLNTVIELISNKDYQRLSTLFRYPFATRCGEKTIIIDDRQDFYVYTDDILNDNFIGIIKKSLDEESFFEHPQGLMLNERGDIWVYEIDGELLLLPLP